MGHWARVHLQRDPAVTDLAWLALLAGLTVLTFGFVRLCDVS
jgi:hypothetical protein